MTRNQLSILAGAILLAGFSCTPDKGGAAEGETVGDGGHGAEGQEDDSPVAEPEPSPVEPLADGSHSVFGLRVPRGMKPAAGPNQVYRFEGTFELRHVKRYVMRQVETGTLLEEPTGFLIREARVVEPVGETPANALLAVRIFRGRRGGASMDVWVELDSLAALRKGKGGAGHGVGGAGKSDDQPPLPQLNASQRAKRLEQRKQTLDALEAAGGGMGLPKDPENPLNY